MKLKKIPIKKYKKPILKIKLKKIKKTNFRPITLA